MCRATKPVPNLAFALIVTGLLILYGEFIWVGKLLFGIAGSTIALMGVALLWPLPHSGTGIFLIAASVACFSLEARFQTYRTAGIVATLCFAYGFWRLLSTQPIAPLLVFPLSALFGLITTALLSIARRARWNKLSA